MPVIKCSHAYGMLWDGEYACCKICETEWMMTSFGWKQVGFIPPEKKWQPRTKAKKYAPKKNFGRR